jgi:phage-related protein
MALAVFNPPIPPSSVRKRPEVRVLTASFGDGYQQKVADGLNNVRKVFALEWEVLTPAQADAIVTFLESHGGYKPFLYASPAAPPTSSSIARSGKTPSAAPACAPCPPRSSRVSACHDARARRHQARPPSLAPRLASVPSARPAPGCLPQTATSPKPVTWPVWSLTASAPAPATSSSKPTSPRNRSRASLVLLRICGERFGSYPASLSN